MMDAPRIQPTARPRRRLVLGRDDDGTVVSLAVSGRNILIAGDPKSGKSWVAGLLCEQLILQGYCVCLIDPEGDYTALEALPGVVLRGGDDQVPPMNEVERILRHPDASLIIDLVRVPAPKKRRYVELLLGTLAQLRGETGLPHRIVVDEAHYFLHDPEQAHLLDHEFGGYTLITYQVSGLHAEVLASTECVVVTRITQPAEADLLARAWRTDGPPVPDWSETLSALQLDQAVLLPCSTESGGILRRVRLAPRLTNHVRHRHKYLDLHVHQAVAFWFDLGPSRASVRSLQEMVDILAAAPLDRISAHAQRGDFSRWVRDVFADLALADHLRDIEERHRLGLVPDIGSALIHAVRERYRVATAFL